MVPGPGSYLENVAKTASNLSIYLKPLPKSFPREHRANPFSPKHTENPGPGNYDYPSEFGVYISKNSTETAK